MFSLLFPFTGIVYNAFTLTTRLKLYWISVKPHVLSWNSIIWTKHQVNQSLIIKTLRSNCRESHFPKRPTISHPTEMLSIFQRQYSIQPAKYTGHGLAELLDPHFNYPAKILCCISPWKYYTKWIFQRSLSESRIGVTYIESILPIETRSMQP